MPRPMKTAVAFSVASIIPLLAVPVSIVGTFAVMHVFGF